MDINFSLPKAILPFLKDKVDDFYLAGGTALSMFYYQHRESFDLDFFTGEFSRDRISEIIFDLKNSSGWAVELLSERDQKGFIKISMYMVKMGRGKECKIDFVEDCVDLTQPLKRVDGINILSLEDIYLRKIFTIAGHVPDVNDIGQNILRGSRQKAKDFYDIYCLSTITMPLSECALRYCSAVVQEGIIRWYQTYDRMTIMTDLLELETKIKPDYRVIDKHFSKEINALGDAFI